MSQCLISVLCSCLDNMQASVNEEGHTLKINSYNVQFYTGLTCKAEQALFTREYYLDVEPTQFSLRI